MKAENDAISGLGRPTLRLVAKSSGLHRPSPCSILPWAADPCTRTAQAGTAVGLPPLQPFVPRPTAAQDRETGPGVVWAFGTHFRAGTRRSRARLGMSTPDVASGLPLSRWLYRVFPATLVQPIKEESMRLRWRAHGAFCSRVLRIGADRESLRAGQAPRPAAGTIESGAVESGTVEIVARRHAREHRDGR